MSTEAAKMAAVRELWSLTNRSLAVRSRYHLPLGLGVVSDHLRTFSISGVLNQAEKEQELQKNPFYTKYETKIQELRRTKSDEYEARVAKKDEVMKQPLGHSKQGEFIRLMEGKGSVWIRMCKGPPLLYIIWMVKNKKQAERATGQRIGFSKDKTLQSILNLDMMKEKTPDEIGQIWNQYFALKNTISAVIPGTTFDLMHSRSQKCPTFLYALPRQAGYEFFVGQWSATELHFSSLINIQSLGENSPSQLIIYHYPDLQKKKGIVLLTAEIDTTFLNVQEAQCLANEAQLFYATDCEQIFNLVETFNHKPSDFKHMSVIAEIEQCGIGGTLRNQKAET
ncbi:ATP synthase mitochondrial F1 complex assembly factor 1 isoform X1 [Stegostoma tigrinum]|uniref:ATP synthase mitochondrial F1 complex assembly factor 1 isoform X1 n=1 Tax=Stegostoma tigrinum TaxID=3053191 RepID=UPI00286FE4BD|nr:ATP synthase mitochondrial F1 complex assembly factor 1 isoform X1 [Stegostoma tigrinum]